MLEKSRIPHISIENEPIYFVIRIRRYWAKYPMRGPVAMTSVMYLLTKID
jgi:hypothetical protein